jgi:hypothetical protein
VKHFDGMIARQAHNYLFSLKHISDGNLKIYCPR